MIKVSSVRFLVQIKANKKKEKCPEDYSITPLDWSWLVHEMFVEGNALTFLNGLLQQFTFRRLFWLKSLLSVWLKFSY